MGATLLIMLCRSGTAKAQVVHGLTVFLNQLVPQTKSTAQTTIHGSSAIHISADDTGLVDAVLGGIVLADSSWLRNAGESHSSFGLHTFRNSTRHAIEISEAPISTIHGLM